MPNNLKIIIILKFLNKNNFIFPYNNLIISNYIRFLKYIKKINLKILNLTCSDFLLINEMPLYFILIHYALSFTKYYIS